MPSHDIIDNRSKKLVDHINRTLSSTGAARGSIRHCTQKRNDCIE